MVNVLEAIVAYTLFTMFIVLFSVAMFGYCMGWSDPTAPIKYAKKLSNEEALGDMDGLIPESEANEANDEEKGNGSVELIQEKETGKIKYKSMDSFGKEGELSKVPPPPPESASFTSSSSTGSSKNDGKRSIVSPLKETAMAGDLDSNNVAAVYSAFEETPISPTTPPPAVASVSKSFTPNSSMKNKIKQRKAEEEEKKKKKLEEEADSVVDETVAVAAVSEVGVVVEEERKKGEDIITDAASVQSTNSGSASISGSTKKRPSKVKPKKKKKEEPSEEVVPTQEVVEDI